MGKANRSVRKGVIARNGLAVTRMNQNTENDLENLKRRNTE
jgi:hypothetical protein